MVLSFSLPSGISYFSTNVENFNAREANADAAAPQAQNFSALK